jgi:hypothetical protein
MAIQRSIMAPITSGLLYTQIGHATPYLLGSGIMVLAAPPLFQQKWGSKTRIGKNL